MPGRTCPEEHTATYWAPEAPFKRVTKECIEQMNDDRSNSLGAKTEEDQLANWKVLRWRAVYVEKKGVRAPIAEQILKTEK